MIDVSYYISKIECLKWYMELWLINYNSNALTFFNETGMIIYTSKQFPTFDIFWNRYKHFYLCTD